MDVTLLMFSPEDQCWEYLGCFMEVNLLVLSSGPMLGILRLLHGGQFAGSLQWTNVRNT